MIVFDKYGHEYKIGINRKLKFEKFKEIYSNIPFDYEKVFVQLGGKLPVKKLKDDIRGTSEKIKKD